MLRLFRILNEENELKTYQNLMFDEERALYGVRNAKIVKCAFSGPADGESALKEAGDIQVIGCDFRLRYPLWHVKNAELENSRLTETCRAALWYNQNVRLRNCRLEGIKAIRECRDVSIEDCQISSEEFGWMSRGVRISHTRLLSEYPFLKCGDMKLERFTLQGKYSFQYVENVEIRDSVLDTKDAFWHSVNATIYDSVLKGEYLAWYSENLHLVRCRIIGTQPFCYARGLVLDDCEMVGCDRAFEKSDVQATIKGSIESVKNPASGRIIADSIGEVIQDDESANSNACIIEVRNILEHASVTPTPWQGVSNG